MHSWGSDPIRAQAADARRPVSADVRKEAATCARGSRGPGRERRDATIACGAQPGRPGAPSAFPISAASRRNTPGSRSSALCATPDNTMFSP